MIARTMARCPLIVAAYLCLAAGRAPKPERIAIPAGTFTQGSTRGDEDERPARKVTLKAFSIDRTEVTRGDYAACVAAKRCKAPAHEETAPDPKLPMTNVDWAEAQAYCKFAGARLPTEAEWEKAARGTDGRIYPWGDTFDEARCNTRESGISTTTPVGRYPNGASPYHIQDMAGNVWEWTSSLFQPYPYRKNDGRENRDSTENRVLRGDSWVGFRRYARVACRNGGDGPDDGVVNGFRLAWARAGG
jgi:formylglycine-generating enzyme required for sulfatase activity